MDLAGCGGHRGFASPVKCPINGCITAPPTTGVAELDFRAVRPHRSRASPSYGTDGRGNTCPSLTERLGPHYSGAG